VMVLSNDFFSTGSGFTENRSVGLGSLCVPRVNFSAEKPGSVRPVSFWTV
jgi:hypothetical protein